MNGVVYFPRMAKNGKSIRRQRNLVRAKDRNSIYIVFDEDIEEGFAAKFNAIARGNRRNVKQEAINVLKEHADSFPTID